MSQYEKIREFTRLSIKLFAWLSRDNQSISGTVRDVSMKGIYVLTPEQLPIHSVCHVSLSFSENRDDLLIETDGQVVRSDGEGMAIQFQEMEIESYHHMRNLVLYNSTGEVHDQIEDELDSHLGLKKSKH